MGSTGTTRRAGLTDRAFFEQEFPEMLGRQGAIAACTSLRTSGEWSRVFYAAVKNNDTASYKPGATWALVVLMQQAGQTFYYKEMDESMGPAEDECPANILDLLSPTDSEWANEWRARCRVNAERKAKAKLKPGQVVTFARGYDFSNGQTVTTFRYGKEGRKIRWTALVDGYPAFVCRLPADWYLRAYEVA